MISKEQKRKIGKKNKESGGRFELKVRKDLENKGWFVSKWMNNVDLEEGKLIPAKHKFNPFNKVMTIGTGFPDFIAFIHCDDKSNYQFMNSLTNGFYENSVIGVEVKSNGYLSPEEKLKCEWLLSNKVFSDIFIASKGEKRGEIKYTKLIKNGII